MVKAKFKNRTNLSIQDLNKDRNNVVGYIICFDEQIIGYCQVYNAYSLFSKEKIFAESICGVDLFIGNVSFLYKGIGLRILNELESKILLPHYKWCLADPAKDNLSAVRAFQKAGFQMLEILEEKHQYALMIKELIDF